MEVEDDVLYMVVIRVHETRQICVLRMEVDHDVLSLDV